MPLRILVVEDEPTNMQIISLGLTNLGHEVIPAYEPLKGLELAATCKPDVILMDLMFQGAPFDGMETIRRLKANPVTAKIPVVAQTAAVLEFAERAVLEAGADGFVQKPFRRKQLVEAIEAALAGQAPIAWHRVPVPRPPVSQPMYMRHGVASPE